MTTTIDISAMVRGPRAAYIEAGQGSRDRLRRYFQGLALVVETLGRELQAHGQTAKRQAEGLRALAFVERARALAAADQLHRAVMVLLFPPAVAAASWGGEAPAWLVKQGKALRSSILARTAVELNAVHRDEQKVWDNAQAFVSVMYEPFVDVLIAASPAPAVAAAGSARGTIAAAQGVENAAAIGAGIQSAVMPGLRKLAWQLALVAAIGGAMYVAVQSDRARGLLR